MRNFYITYRENEKLSPLVAEISWARNFAVLMFAARGYLEPELKEMFFALDLTESDVFGVRRAKWAMAANGSPTLAFTPDNETDDYAMATRASTGRVREHPGWRS